MGRFRVHLSYDGHENVDSADVEAEIWQAAIRLAISRYARWRLPKTVRYSRVGEDLVRTIAIVGTPGDYQLVLLDPD